MADSPVVCSSVLGLETELQEGRGREGGYDGAEEGFAMTHDGHRRG